MSDQSGERKDARVWDRIETLFRDHLTERLDAIDAALAGIIETDIAMRQEIQDALNELSTKLTDFLAAHQTEVDTDTADVVSAIQAIGATLQVPAASAAPASPPATSPTGDTTGAAVDASGQPLADLTGHGATDAAAPASDV